MYKEVLLYTSSDPLIQRLRLRLRLHLRLELCAFTSQPHLPRNSQQFLHPENTVLTINSIPVELSHQRVHLQ